MVIKFDEFREQASPAGKLASAELHFTAGPLAGLKLIGFDVWERRSANGGRAVTFPARVYSVNGERRSFALLRPIEDTATRDRMSDLILEAYTAREALEAAGRAFLDEQAIALSRAAR